MRADTRAFSSLGTYVSPSWVPWWLLWFSRENTNAMRGPAKQLLNQTIILFHKRFLEINKCQNYLKLASQILFVGPGSLIRV